MTRSVSPASVAVRAIIHQIGILLKNRSAAGLKNVVAKTGTSNHNSRGSALIPSDFSQTPRTKPPKYSFQAMRTPLPKSARNGGWPPATRAQFEALRGPTGALLIGDAKTVAKKILYVNEVLGGISRITFQMGVSTLPHEKMLHAIEILGTQVAPIVRTELSVTQVRAL